MPSGPQDARLEERVDLLSRDCLDHVAEDARARVRTPSSSPGSNSSGRSSSVLLGLLHDLRQHRAREPVADAGRVRQQLTDRDRPLGRSRLVAGVGVVELR